MMGYPSLSNPSVRISFLVVPLGLGGVGFSLSSWCWSLVLLVFFISSSTLDLRSLYFEALFSGCSCTAWMFIIYWCCAANALFGCSIALPYSSLIPTEPVVWCLMLAASFVKNSFKLVKFLAIVGLSCHVSHGRLNNIVSYMSRYAEKIIFFLG